ncbi:MAG: MBL fold metallo-hydrolase [Acidobacteria bacterium]|nr:MBL fold metallo-hydrolase [Acidobacteriota bacterium]
MVKAIFRYGLLIVLSVGLTALYFSTFYVARDSAIVFQTVQPLTSVTDRRGNQERVPISTTQALKPGQLLNIAEYPIGEIHIQKLTANSYWVSNSNHCMTLYVGEKECLLVDAPASLFVDRLLERIKAITPNPVTTLVYSHPHIDHIGGAAKLLRALVKRGIVPRVIASDRFVRESRRYQLPVPQPTEVLPAPRASFSFDNKEFKLVTPVEFGHSGADSYILFPDKVITFIDFVQAGRLPLHAVSGVQNMLGYINFLRHVMGEDWLYANVGHINVGSRQDVARTLEYFKDLYEAWFEIVPDNNTGVAESLRAKAKDEHKAVWLRNLTDRVARKIALKVQSKWGDQPHFELARDHALKVWWDAFLHYDFSNHPEIRPDFTPIQPPE